MKRTSHGSIWEKRETKEKITKDVHNSLKFV